MLDSAPPLSIRRICELADISRPTAYAEIHAGRLRAYKLAGKTVVWPEDYQTWRTARPLPVNTAPVAADQPSVEHQDKKTLSGQRAAAPRGKPPVPRGVPAAGNGASP